MNTTKRLSRRTLAKGAAWTAPVVLTAVAAPAYASSLPCLKGQALLSNPGSDAVVTTLAFPPSLVTAAVTYSAQAWQDQTPGDTGQVRSTEFPGGTQWNYVTLRHPEGADTGDTVTMTISFSQPVQNLTLRVTNIDKVTGDFIDEIVVGPATFEATVGPRVSLSGGGFKATAEGAITSNQGDVTLFWSAPVQQVHITLRAADDDNASFDGQYVGVGLIGFDNCP
jgi:hypothetical protein